MELDLGRTISNETLHWLDVVIFLIPNWKWLVMAAGLLFGYFSLGLARWFFQFLKTNYGKHHRLPLVVTYFFNCEIHRPLAWLVAAGIWHLTLQSLDLHESFSHFAAVLAHLIVLISMMRLAYMGVVSVGLMMDDLVKDSKNSLDSQLAPFATKVLKIVVITLGFLFSLQSLGFNVGAVLAGLGIGSLALALAAQDTAANLFGSITILLDRPFQRGDSIKFGDIEGTVEEVGFRSTQIRTAYKSIVTIPNSTMAKANIDNMGVRPNRRIRHTLSIHAQTSPELIEFFVDRLRSLLSQHPMVVAGSPSVHVQGIGEYSLKLGIEVFVNVTSDSQEAQLQQELLLAILRTSAEMGVQLAYPSQEIKLIQTQSPN